MSNKVYYLKNPAGIIISKFVVEKATDAYVCGTCYLVTSWTTDNKPIDEEFFVQAYCKWDSCTHWYFYGEDFNELSKNVDGYYHLCGSSCVLNHVRAMCFIWKLVADIMAELSGVGDDYDPDIIEEYFDGDDITNLCALMLKDYTIEEVKNENN